MTYSQPGIRQVSTEVSPQAPNRRQISSVGGVSAGPSTSYRPPVSVGDARGQALSVAAESFINAFREPAQESIAKWQESERQRAAADFIQANPSFTAEGMRNLTDEQRGVLNRFDPRTQQILVEQRVAQASLAYATKFGQDVLASDIITQGDDPLGDPVEAQARRGAEILRLKQEAQAAVGFGELPGFARMAVLDSVAKAEQMALGDARGARMAEERLLQKKQDMEYLGTTLEIGAAQAAQASVQAPPLSDDEIGLAIPIQQAGAPSAMEFPANAVSGPVAAATPTDLAPPPVPADEAGGAPPAPSLPPPRRAIELATVDAKMFLEGSDPISEALRRIRSGEGTWTSVNRGVAGDTPGGIPELPNMTLAEVKALQRQGYFAVGAYQFIPETLAQAQREAGISDSTRFTPEVQTRLALQLILGGTKRKALTDYLYGRSENVDAAEEAFANEWAAVRGPGGKGSYDGDSAGNRASVSLRDLLPAMREQVMAGGTPQSMGAPIQVRVQERRQLATMSVQQAVESVAAFDQEAARRLQQGTKPRELSGEILWNLDDQLSKIDARVSDPYEADQQKLAALGNIQQMLSQSTVEWGGNTFLDIPSAGKEGNGLTVREYIRKKSVEISRRMQQDAEGLIGQYLPGELINQLLTQQVPFDQRPAFRAQLYQTARQTGLSHRQAITLVDGSDKMMDRTASDMRQGTEDILFREFGTDLYGQEAMSPEQMSAARERILGAARSGRIPASALPQALARLESRGVFTPEAFGRATIFETDPQKSPLAQTINEETSQFLSDRDDAIQAGTYPAGRELIEESKVPGRLREFIAKKYTELVASEVGSSDKPVTPDQARLLLQKAVEQGVATFRQQELGPGQLSGLARFNASVQTVKQRLDQNGGQLTLDVFPKFYVDATRKRLNRQDVTPKEVGDTFMNGAGLQKLEDGSPAFPNRRRPGSNKPLLQELMQEAKQTRQRQQAPTMNRYGIPGRQSSASPEPMSQTMASVGSELEQVAVVAPAGEQPQETRPGVAESKPEGAPEPETVVVGAALGEALAVQLMQRRQGDQMLAFDPMGVMRNLINGSSVKEFTDVLQGRKKLTPSTPPLPQMKANAPLPPMPTQVDSNTHPAAIAIGLAEGTRRPDGGKTEAWYGHDDPNVPGRINIGTYSANAADFASPQAADAYWNKRLTTKSMEAARLLHARRLKPTHVGWHRLMFNILDLEIQAPAANRMDGFLGKLSEIAQNGYTVEAIAKARADSYINPATGKLETSFASYDALLADQRRRAGMYDFKGRIQ